MQTNRSSFNAVFSLLLSAMVSACAQNQPAYTELTSPDATSGDGFGWDFGGLPDLTRDGVGEFYVHGARAVHIYDGATLKLLYSVDALRCEIAYPTHSMDSAGALNGDGIPDLMVGQICGGQSPRTTIRIHH